MGIERMKRMRSVLAGMLFSLVGPAVAAYQPSRIANFSCLATVGSSDPTPFTLGFVSVTTDAFPVGEPLLIRGVGLTLSQFGLGNLMVNPLLTMWEGSRNLGTIAGFGDIDQGAAAAVGAFPLLASSHDAATIDPVGPGSFSVQIGGQTTFGGTVLGEIYDEAFTNSGNYLANLSALSYVHSSSSSTVGFVLAGSVSRTILIRAVGPSLSNFGVAHPMPDPVVVLYGAYNGAQGVLASNTGWLGNVPIATASKSVGAFSLARGSRDAAVLVTLGPGTYTFTVSSQSETAGTVLGEIYLLPE